MTSTPTTLENIEEICSAKGIRLTDTRRQVLEIILESDTPLGAYEILNRLSESKNNAVPMTVYRALDFLMDNGLVHKVESMNAYFACTHPGDEHGYQLLVCGQCGHVVETSDPKLENAIKKQASHEGFKIANAAVEVTGLCSDCQGADGAQ
ncbi:Fur family transcriptional regulator [Aestuariispira ectoiniformans]|uniref:Fur family transcriptional regulator n=1 Tax=Aestuariispira ectoiniformans TaxID=2775080 RepID=UPI00223AC72A|nr:Fur family transcriptional regulator [Aestuariispira ectoiniformans]